MLSNVEQATELSFESLSEATHRISEHKDLLDAKRKIKEARTTFLEDASNVTSRLKEDPLLDDMVLPIVFPGSPRSPRGDKRRQPSLQRLVVHQLGHQQDLTRCLLAPSPSQRRYV